jgi:formylglycine-generating enzyme required for sulfatase activity
MSPEELAAERTDLIGPLREAISALRQMRAVVRTMPDMPPGAAPGRAAPPGYELLEELGRGGMGVVYKARQVSLNRVVALKVVLSGGHAGPEERLRFLQEAEAIAQVRHPGIVQVFDFGTHNELPWFSLEFCEGGSLAERLRQGPLPPREAAEVVEKVARTVRAAHEAGIVHRDLKPANVLLTGRGEPRVTDFGLAKRADAASHTETGAVMGTPAYMAPEQAEGKKDIGPPADVWALGAVLYACLTGRPPFQAATPMETVHQVSSDDPVPAQRLNPNVPADLETICHKCLQKAPARRYDSAAELADDLRRFLDGGPIHARPVGWTERTSKWAARNPALSVSAAVIALLLVVGVSLVTWQWRVAVDALERARTEQSRRVLAQVDALSRAAPGEVSSILASLEEHRDEVLPRLREAYGAETGRLRKMRLALALMPSAPDEVLGPLMEWMLEAEDPAEVLLARDALMPHAADLREGLWRQKGLRSRVALAAFDPHSPRWKGEVHEVLEGMLSANALHLGAWVQGLRPVRAALVGPLKEAFRKEGPHQKAAALILADYCADDANTLAELLQDANTEQYAVLRFALDRHREKMLALMEEAVARQPGDWKDAPLPKSWQAPAEAVVKEITSAGGMVMERFALCQALPLDRVAAVAEALRPCGYRPTRVRPYAEGGSVKAAVVWQRDGRDWQLRIGLTATQATKASEGKLVLADMSNYRVGDGERYALLWTGGEAGEFAGFFIGVQKDQLPATIANATARGLVPATINGLAGDDGVSHFCGVCRGWPDLLNVWGVRANRSRDQFEDDLFAGQYLLLDVGAYVWKDTTARPPVEQLQFANTWVALAGLEAKALIALPHQPHLAQSRELVSRGWRPVGLSVAGGRVTSAWHRPKPVARQAELAGWRQARAAATLLNLGRPEKAWPVLRHSDNPTAQSCLIADAAPLKVDAQLLLRRLGVEKDAGARRALVLALGEYSEKELPAGVRGPLVKKLLNWYRDDPDPGIHSAINWLLRFSREGPVARPLDWGQAETLDRIDADLTGKPAGKKRWYVNGQGQMYVVVPGPSEFRMGSPLGEVGRLNPEDEKPHRRVIPHSFAIAAAPVTMHSWRTFLAENPGVPHLDLKWHSPDPDCPAVLTMYAAMAYCNWLSKKEGIPKDQWCYPDKIEEGMKLPADLLKLKGYRLPMEAEWEIAARAGTTTSRSFGEGSSLFGRHGWCADNAHNRTWPVGMKRPNPWGLSDVHGNVQNWCNDIGEYYPLDPRQTTALINPVINDKARRVLRGGSFLDQGLTVRSANRRKLLPSTWNVGSGFRPCRTID